MNQTSEISPFLQQIHRISIHEETTVDSITSQYCFAITADTCWKESWDLRNETQANVSLQNCFKEIKLEMYTIAQVSVIYLGRKYLKVSILF
jgi:hypothetical protein